MDSLTSAKFAFERSCDAVNLMIEHVVFRDSLPDVWFRALRHLNRDLHVPLEAQEDFDFLLDVMDGWIHVCPREGLCIRPEITEAQLSRAGGAVQAVAHAITLSYGIALDNETREANEVNEMAPRQYAYFLWYPFGEYSKEDPDLVRLREWNPSPEQRRNHNWN